ALSCDGAHFRRKQSPGSGAHFRGTSFAKTPDGMCIRRRTFAGHANRAAETARTLAFAILFVEDFLAKVERARVVRLSEPEHRLLPHFRIFVRLRDLN